MYMTTRADTYVCSQVTLRAEIICSGHTHHLEVEDNVTRDCSFATLGKPSVKTDNEELLVIGAHGNIHR